MKIWILVLLVIALTWGATRNVEDDEDQYDDAPAEWGDDNGDDEGQDDGEDDSADEFRRLDDDEEECDETADDN